MEQIMDTQRRALANFNFSQKYARYDAGEKRREAWDESVDRVMKMHRDHLNSESKGYLAEALNVELNAITNAYKNRLLLGSQRSLQFGGQAVLKKHARSYNCTSCYVDRPSRFAQSLYLLLCGAGVGYSVQDHHVAQLPNIRDKEILLNLSYDRFIIEDTIEGWADALDAVIDAYMGTRSTLPDFDFSQIRPKGSPIHSCGGQAPGPYPLRVMLQQAELLLSERAGTKLKPSDASDLMCIAADCVLAGGMRRAALLCMFSVGTTDQEMMIYKSRDEWWQTHPYRARANISAVVLRDDPDAETHFAKVFEHTRRYGEPATIWVDSTEIAYNPCVEIAMCPTLIKDPQGQVIDISKALLDPSKRESWIEQGYTFETGFQFCNLCEINVGAWHNLSYDEAADVVKLATILGCIQASYTGTDNDYLSRTVTRQILERESLLGVSLTGLASGPSWAREQETLEAMAEVAKETARTYWKKCGLKSMPARICTVKPSGNAAVNLGCSSGVHYEHSRRFIRRVQAPKSSPIVQAYKSVNEEAVEHSVWSQHQTDDCIAFAIEAPNTALFREDHSAIEFLDWVKTVQQAWVGRGVLRPHSVEGLTHNVSNTCSVRPDEWDRVAEKLLEGRSAYGGVSCLSASGDYDYPQPPFQAIYAPSEVAHDDPYRQKKLDAYEYWCSLREHSLPLDFSHVVEEQDNTTLSQELACSGGACELSLTF
jgi:ribonucleoside-triphosphate reductase (thioredoxin)